MAKESSQKYSKSKIKLFLFFLIVASVFWILTKFSRDFTTTLNAKIKYEHLPETTALAQDNTQEVSFDLTANGFEILFYKFKKPALVIDVAQYYQKGNDSFTVSRNELMRILSSSFNKYMEIKNISVDHLNVKLDPIVLKKVPILPRTDIAFKDGFKPVDSIVLTPDSVTISGPKESLKEIDSVITEKLELKNVEKNISQMVKIESPSDVVVEMKPEKVKLEWIVSEFSQGQFTVPVEVINLPPGMELKLVPNRISISFDIAVDKFSAVSSENFRVVCDYSERNQEENFMLPKLAKKPEGALNIVFDPKKIDFFVFK